MSRWEALTVRMARNRPRAEEFAPLALCIALGCARAEDIHLGDGRQVRGGGTDAGASPGLRPVADRAAEEGGAAADDDGGNAEDSPAAGPDSGPADGAGEAGVPGDGGALDGPDASGDDRDGAAPEDGAAGGCVPVDCSAYAARCGTLSDGCGGWIECRDSGCHPVFRVTEYETSGADGAGEKLDAWDLILDQPLSRDYFVIVKGSRSTGEYRNSPSGNYVRLVEDPWGTGQLGTSAGPDVIRLARRSTTTDGIWTGAVTVVESLRDPAGAGFELLDVRVVQLPDNPSTGVHTGTVTAAAVWSDLDRVMLLGGVNGAGCIADNNLHRDHYACHVNLFPSGSQTLNWARVRPASGFFSSMAAASTTVMVLQWGSEWSVQRRTVTGSASGASAASPGHYDTAPIDPVSRGGTWVWGTGYAYLSGDASNAGASAEGSLITLGDGVNVNETESRVAVGQQTSVTNKAFTVYALTHRELAVDHRFRASAAGTAVELGTTGAAGCADRMAVGYNGLAYTGDAWERALFHSLYPGGTTLRMVRHSDSSSWAAWAQGIRFCGILSRGE